MPEDLFARLVSASGEVVGERRQVVALFTDLEGYTWLSERLGEEACVD